MPMIAFAQYVLLIHLAAGWNFVDAPEGPRDGRHTAAHVDAPTRLCDPFGRRDVRGVVSDDDDPHGLIDSYQLGRQTTSASVLTSRRARADLAGNPAGFLAARSGGPAGIGRRKPHSRVCPVPVGSIDDGLTWLADQFAAGYEAMGRGPPGEHRAGITGPILRQANPSDTPTGPITPEMHPWRILGRRSTITSRAS